MGDSFVGVPSLLLVGALAYLLGALPLADQISRRNGVDIFSVGTGLAGASNVRRCVGRVPALFVFVGDLGKGSLAIIIGEYLGLEGPWMLAPAVAVVVGHWKSVFTGFRGGDGLTPLGGAIIAMFPVYGVISIAVALVIALGGQLLPYSSLLSVVFGYGTLVTLVLGYDRYNGDEALALGMGGVSGFVLAHALLGHRRRNSPAEPEEWEDLEADNAAGESGTRS